MYSTGITPDKTAGEICGLLARLGASASMMQYGPDGDVEALSFYVEGPTGQLAFKLPVKWQPVQKAMRKDRGTPNKFANEKQARRTAWRIALRWIQAQLALVEVGCADAAEVFFPYLTDGKTTLYERALDANFQHLLAAPEEE
jgi:hypothetical protein